MAARLYRSQERVIAGVCAGLARHLGLNVGAVRAGMVAAAFAFGAGMFLYAWLWLLTPMAGEGTVQGSAGPTDDGAPRLALFRPAREASAGAGASPRSRLGIRNVLVGAVFVLVAGAILAQRAGLNLPLGTVLPLAVIAVGAFLAWMQLDQTRRVGLLNVARIGTPVSVLRFFGGLALVVVGVLVVVSGTGSWALLWPSVLASVAVLAGVGLVLAPWVLTFWREFQAERAGRIRETERAEIAAHLHDSVLQTLALIQRRADSPQDVIRLARAQERELRQWIFQDADRDSSRLASRLKTACAEVEDQYGQVVEVVTVGDAPMSDAHHALLRATREAVVNGVRHGGTPVSVYLEARADGVDVFVKDRGPGFDLAQVGADRLGVRESVVGRMHRNGGSAEILSAPAGTEVRLHLPAPASEEEQQ